MGFRTPQLPSPAIFLLACARDFFSLTARANDDDRSLALSEPEKSKISAKPNELQDSLKLAAIRQRIGLVTTVGALPAAGKKSLRTLSNVFYSPSKVQKCMLFI